MKRDLPLLLLVLLSLPLLPLLFVLAMVDGASRGVFGRWLAKDVDC